MTRVNVGVIFGGCSGEHEVSIRSAQAISRGLQEGSNTAKYHVIPFYVCKDGSWLSGEAAQAVLASGQALAAVRSDSRGRLPTSPEVDQVDIWFPVLHGPNGEDGTLQGLLSLMQMPFVGSGVLGSALGMDKIAMKQAFAQAGLPQVNYVPVSRSEIWSNPCVFPKLCDRIEADLGYPCFVKPANLGSSVGISKVLNRASLEAALDNAASYDRRVIVEAGVIAREIECAVLGNDNPKASVVGEISYRADFYDYETKYTDGLAKITIPASLPAAVAEQIQEAALIAFEAIDAAGIARVDFFYIEATGAVLINEINTMPGFTATSMYPMMWEASGLSFEQLVDQLVQLGLERTSG